MRWEGRRVSENIEDLRRAGPVAAAGGGIGGLILMLIGMYYGVDLSGMTGMLPEERSRPQATSPAQDRAARFVGVVLADTEDVWNDLFRRQGRQYREPRLVMFNGRVRSACGIAGSAVGPFYCPGDRKVYMDLEFFDELARRFEAPGDFAQAYVIAHEVGHHVQNLLGTSGRVDAMRGRLSEEEMNELSVRLELQADFLAGVWAHHAQRTKDILESGDIEEALGAATAIGDDKLQMEGQGYVVPESFTHGTSEQRVRWFRRGYESGDLSKGDTFNARQL